MLVTLWDISKGEECKIKESLFNSREISVKQNKEKGEIAPRC